MSHLLNRLLAEKSVLMADGATGTNLFDIGLASGEAPELWNESTSDKITDMHRGFVDAGADIILTNSFGGTRHRLKLHHADDRVFELNEKAAKLARAAADGAGRPVVVAGSVGPTGELLAPLGALTQADAQEAFVEQIAGLKSGGVDAIWIETMSAPEEMQAAAQAAAASGLPYVLTASFDTAGRTMMGMAPGDIHRTLAPADGSIGPLAVGANCGVGASDLLASILDITAADPNAIVVAKANCGIPVIKGDQVVYSGSPELMADYARLAIDAGARIIGGCCGTSCEHLTAMRTAIDAHQRSERPSLDQIVAATGALVNQTASAGAGAPKRERRRRRA